MDHLGKKANFSVSFRIWSKKHELKVLSNIIKTVFHAGIGRNIKFIERLTEDIAYVFCDLGKFENIETLNENADLVLSLLCNNHEFHASLKSMDVDAVLWISIFANDSVMDDVCCKFSETTKTKAKKMWIDVFVEDYTNLENGNPKKIWIVKT